MSETGIEEWDTVPDHQHHPESHWGWKCLWCAAGVACLYIIYLT